MSPGEIRACYRLYAAHRRSHRPAVVEHFGHLRKMLASFISAVERAGLSTLNEGQSVEFEEVENRGKISAENLKVAR
jgi:hypothetical protein